MALSLCADIQQNELKSNLILFIKFNLQGDTDNTLCNIMIRPRRKNKGRMVWWGGIHVGQGNKGSSHWGHYI